MTTGVAMAVESAAEVAGEVVAGEPISTFDSTLSSDVGAVLRS